MRHTFLCIICVMLVAYATSPRAQVPATPGSSPSEAPVATPDTSASQYQSNAQLVQLVPGTTIVTPYSTPEGGDLESIKQIVSNDARGLRFHYSSTQDWFCVWPQGGAVKVELDDEGNFTLTIKFALDFLRGRRCAFQRKFEVVGIAVVVGTVEPGGHEVAEVLRADSTLKLLIAGHTDAIGSDAYNRGLSEQRASSVVANLVGQGIDASRLTAEGFGASEPVADNVSVEGRAENRRVEFIRQ